MIVVGDGDEVAGKGWDGVTGVNNRDPRSWGRCGAKSLCLQQPRQILDSTANNLLPYTKPKIDEGSLIQNPIRYTSNNGPSPTQKSQSASSQDHPTQADRQPSHQAQKGGAGEAGADEEEAFFGLDGADGEESGWESGSFGNVEWGQEGQEEGIEEGLSLVTTGGMNRC